VIAAGRRAGALAIFALDLVAGAFMGALAVLVAAQVAARYVFGGSLVWSEELARLLFVWMILLAATHAPPMRIDALVGALPRRLAALCALFGDLVVAGLTLVLVWGALGMAELTENDTYVALGVAVSWAYVAVWLSGVLWIVRTVVDAARHAAALFGRAPV
jgi:TRAP-type C4-dicarboxylate transport system permease small subunit